MDLVIERGDIVICVLTGNYGKPRPAVVIQSDLFNSVHASMTLCPITTHLVDAQLFRLPLPATQKNGLKKPSQCMIDKITTLPRDKINQKIGILTATQLEEVNQAIRRWLDLGNSL